MGHLRDDHPKISKDTVDGKGEIFSEKACDGVSAILRTHRAGYRTIIQTKINIKLRTIRFMMLGD